MRRLARPIPLRHGDRLCARSVLLLLLGLYTATFTGLPDNPDAEVEFQTTSALAREGTLAVGGTPEAEALVEWARHHSPAFGLHRGGPGREDEWFSWFGVGQAFVALPFYAAGAAIAELAPRIQERHRGNERHGVPQSELFQHLVVGWRNPLLGALTGWLVVLSCRRLGAGRRSAWLAGATYGLTTFAWPQARSTLSDVQATFFLFLAFHLMLRVREGFAAREPRPGGRPLSHALLLAGFGASLGLAFLTRVLTAPAIAVLGLGMLGVLFSGRRARDRGLPSASRSRGPLRLLADVAAFALPALLALGLFLHLDDRRFGDPLETGYGEALGSGTFFHYPPLWGLAGLLFAPGKGLLWMAPAIVLLPLGVARARSRGDLLYPFCLAGVAVAVVGPVACMQSWHGAWTYGPRYVLPLLPIAWVGVGLAFDGVAGWKPGRWITAGLCCLGLATALPGVLVDHMTHQDLALQAARIEAPPAEELGGDERSRDEALFQSIQWEPRFAAPWAHWRILRHRLAGLGEEFSVRSLFFVDDDAVVTPTHERDRGFRHLAWVDLHARLGVPRWPGVLLVLVLVDAGILLALHGLDRTLP